MKVQAVIWALVGAATLWVGVNLLHPRHQPLASIPALELPIVDGQRLSLPGKPSLVTFWATSCGPCLQEIPHLIELYQTFAPQGLQLIAVAMPYDPPNHVMAMRAARRLPYPIALDIQGEATRAFGDVRNTPTSFLIAADGQVVHQRVGALDMPALRQQIRQLLES